MVLCVLFGLDIGVIFNEGVFTCEKAVKDNERGLFPDAAPRLT